MYAPRLKLRDRSGAIAAVVAIHVGLAFAFLNLSGTIRLSERQADFTVFDVEDIEPPPPPVEQVRPQPERAEEEEGEASPPNIRSQATPVVAPEPRIELPVPSPVIVSPTPEQGAEPTQGAAEVPGPGTGAGGVGTGTGSGGAGTGPGGGGGGGEGTRPRLVSRPLTSRDYPRDLIRQWPRGARVMVAVRVQLDGRGTDCKINGSSGVPAIDAATCRLVETRLRFRPATNDRGQPYVAWYGYMQYPVNF